MRFFHAPTHTHRHFAYLICTWKLYMQKYNSLVSIIIIFLGNGKFYMLHSLKSTWGCSWNDFLFFALFLINSIYRSHDLKTINSLYNIFHSLPLSQNNWWNPPEEPISSWIRVSSSSLKRPLSWQITHSGLPKVYPSKGGLSNKYCQRYFVSDILNMGYTYTLQRWRCYKPHPSTSMSVEATLGKCMAQKD